MAVVPLDTVVPPMETKSCRNCGQSAKVLRGNLQLQDLVKELGFPIELQNIEVIKCPHCGHVEPLISDVDKLLDVVAFRLLSKRGLTGHT